MSHAPLIMSLLTHATSRIVSTDESKFLLLKAPEMCNCIILMTLIKSNVASILSALEKLFSCEHK